MLLGNSQFANLSAKLIEDPKFEGLSTNQSRIEHIFKNVKPLQEFREEISKVAKTYIEAHGKSLERSQKFRSDADNVLKMKGYQQAIQLYSYALVNAPFPGHDSETKEMQMCYTSRSLAFFEIADFRNALFDTEKSLFLGQTPEMLFQKAFCLRSLNRFGESKQLIDTVLEFKQHHKVDQKPDLIAKFEALKSVVDKQVFAYGEGLPQEEESIIHDYDLWLDHRFELKENEEKGRHLVSKEALPRDTIFIAEKPQNAVLSHENLLSFCTNCFKEVGTAFWPCVFCNEVVFCDRQCHDRGHQNLHWYECRITGLLVGSPFYQTYRMITKVDAEYAFKEGTKTDPKEFDIEKWVQTFYGRDTEPVYRRMRAEKIHHFEGFLSLLDHNDSFDNGANVRQSLMAIEMAILMENKEALKAGEDNKFIEFSAFLVKMYRKSLTNSFNWTKIRQNNKINIGSCLMLYTSLFNHSCYPNAYWSFFEDKVLLRTLRDIEAGEELTISYGPTYTVPLHIRQQITRNQYHFTCKCDLCRMQIIQYPALKCLQCDGPVVFWPSDNKSDLCMDCGHKYEDLREVLFFISNLRLEFDESVKKIYLLENKNITNESLQQIDPDFDRFEDENDVNSCGEEKSEEQKIEKEVQRDFTPEPQSEVNIEPKVVAKVDVDGEPVVDAKPNVYPKSEVDAELEADAEPKTDAETEVDIETESQKEAKNAEIDSCLQKAEALLQKIIELHYEGLDEIFDLEMLLSRIYVERDHFYAAVPHFERILSSIDWSKCGRSGRHWDNLLFITNAYYQYLKDKSVSKKRDWKQCFNSFSALKHSYKAFKESDKSYQWIKGLTIDGRPIESPEVIKEVMREKKGNFSLLKDVYKKLFSV